MKQYHVGIRKQGSKIILQATKNIDALSCEITDYFGLRETTKAKLRKPENRKALLEYLQTYKKYKNCTSLTVEEDTPQGYSFERESESRMDEIRRLRNIVRKLNTPKYYVVIMRGNVEPELSVKSNTEDERDGLAKQIKRDDSNQEDGIYWLNIVEGVPEIGSYSGAFLNDHNEIEEPKAPYYKLSEVRDKWVCAFDTWCCGWDCVRYHGGERDGMPFLYDSKKAVETDEFFNKFTDFAYKADMFKEGRKLLRYADGRMTIEGEYIAR